MRTILRFCLVAAFILALSALAKPTRQETLAALQTIQNSTTQLPWTNAANWNSANDYCTWFGVTCGSDGFSITALRLKQNGLKGELPSVIGTLTELTVLDLCENLLTFNLNILLPLVNLQELILGFKELGAPCVYPYAGTAWGGRTMLCPFGPDFGSAFIAYGPITRNAIRGNATTLLTAITSLTKVTLLGEMSLELTEQSWCKHTKMQYVVFTAMPLLTGGMPECTDQMTQLWSLQITQTSLSSLPQSMSNMTSLIRAALNNNMLRGPYIPAIPPNIFLLNLADNVGLTGPLPKMQAWPYDPAWPNTIWNKLEFFSTMNNYGTTGAFPADYGTAKNLKVFFLTSNRITGMLPADATWPLMLLIGMSSTTLNGSIPDFFDHMYTDYGAALAPPVNGALLPIPFTVKLGITEFYASNTRLTGGLPPSMMRSRSIKTILMMNATLTANIVDMFKAGSRMPALTDLSLSNNNLYGELDQTSICTMLPVISRIQLDNNHITGTIPTCFVNTTLPTATKIYLNNNNITGVFPAGLTTLTMLSILDLSNNRLSGNIPATIGNMASLSALNLASNGFSGAIFDELWKLMQPPLLSQIDLSYNQFYSSISAFAWSSTASPVKNQFGSLKSLNMAYNQLTGPIPDVFVGVRSQINYFNVEGNNITGVIPDMSMMDVVIAGNNNFYDVGYLPSWFKTTPYLVQTGDGTYQCPVLEGTKKKAVITLDPTYYGYRYCRCAANYFGKPPFCRPCLENGICSGRDDSAMVIPAGFFPSPNATNPTHLVRCLDNPIAAEPAFCNPDANANFTCSEGYEGRLCSRCVDNYYSRQSQCVKCPPLAVSIVAVVIVVVGVIVVFLLMRYLPWGKEEVLVGVKVAIVYIQTANAIIAKAGLRWPSAMMGLNRAFDVFGADIGFFSCFASKSVFDLPMTAQVQSLVVLSLIAIVLILFLVVVFQLLAWVEAHASQEGQQIPRISPDLFEQDAPDGTPRNTDGLEWHPRQFNTGVEAFEQSRSVFETADESVKSIRPKFLILRAGFMAVKFLYLPIAVSVMQVFQCERDPGDGLKYMHYSPAQVCSYSDPTYGRNFVLAVIIIPVYIIAFPVFVFVTSYMFRQDRKLVVNIWYFLFMELKRMKAPYLLWTVLRQLILSIILVIIPKAGSLPLLTVLLMSILVVHLWQMPFRLLVHNFLECIVIVALCLDLMLGLAASGEDKPNDDLSAALLIMLQLAVLGLIVYSLIIHGKYKKLPRRECPWPLAQYIIAREPFTECALVHELSPGPLKLQAVPQASGDDDAGSDEVTRSERYMTQEQDEVNTPLDSQV
jgi:hypothetical protein